MFKELQKLFSSKLMWIVLAVSLGFVLFNIFNTIVRRYKDEKAEAQSVKLFFEELDIKGASPDELCDSLYVQAERYRQIYYAGNENAYQKYYAAQKAYDCAEYVYQRFPANRVKVIEDMSYNLRYSADSAYKKRLFQKAIGQYNKVIPLEVKFTGNSSERAYEIFNNKFSEIALLAFIVMMSVRIFSMDYISGAYRLINTSLKSQRMLFFRKLFALFSIIFLLAAVPFAVELFLESDCFGLSNIDLPIQQLQMYEMCPIRLSIAEYFGIKFAAKLVVYFMTAAFSALCAVALRRTLAANVIGMIFEVGGQLLSVFYFLSASRLGETGTEQYNTLRTFVPQSLLNISKYFEGFDCFNFFGFPVNRLLFCMVLTIGLTFIFLFLTYFKLTRIEKAVK